MGSDAGEASGEEASAGRAALLGMELDAEEAPRLRGGHDALGSRDRGGGLGSVGVGEVVGLAAGLDLGPADSRDALRAKPNGATRDDSEPRDAAVLLGLLEGELESEADPKRGAAGCDALHCSLQAGALVDVPPGPTLADGLKPTRIGELNFGIIRPRIAGSLLVDDGDLGPAVVRLLLSAKLLAEPSGAAALGAALRGALPGAPRNVGIILSGGNISPDLLVDLLQKISL